MSDKTQSDLNEPKTASEKDSRVSIINSVQTPLGFFVLVVLIVEVILGLTTNFSNGNDKTFLIIGMLALIFLLVLIVSAMALFHPVSLYGRSAISTEQINKFIQDVRVVNQPKILFASSLPNSPQLQDSLTILRAKFPKSVVATFDLTSSKLLDLLTKHKFDIIHLTATVKEDGSVKFGTGDVLTGDALERFLSLQDTKLLILMGCNSIPLAVKFSAKMNMISATGNIPDNLLLEWQETFYSRLSEGVSISGSYRLANHRIAYQSIRGGVPPVLLMMAEADIQFRK